jgi:hypothetical protein
MHRHFQYFWLCERCNQAMVLRVEEDRVIAVRRESTAESEFSVMATHSAEAA